MSEPSEPALQERWEEDTEVKVMASKIALDAVAPLKTKDTAEAVVVKNFKTAYGIGFTTFQQGSFNHGLVNAGFRCDAKFPDAMRVMVTGG